jgi:hypothetical protein
MPQLIPPPVNTRQLLNLFAFYEAERGLPSILSRLDSAAMTKRQINACVLGRPPDNWQGAVDGENFVPRAALAGRLNSVEFQTRIREIVLNAFPEQRRAIFVHIPKCAGSDLTNGLRRRMPMLHYNLATPEITQKPELFLALKEIALCMAFTDTIAISGHVPLRWYQERGLARYEDDLFTVVREPRSMIYSYISFILTRLKNFVGTRRNDTTNWLKAIGMTEIMPDPTQDYLVGIGSRLLRAPAVTSRNMICNNLGRGQSAGAIENAVLTGIEITETRRYSAWKQSKFGLASEKRVNESLPLYTPELAPPADREFIDEMVAEDQVIYAKIMAALERDDTLSISGTALA